MSIEKTYRQIFNEMADKTANFGEYYKHYGEECATFSVADKLRLYLLDNPAKILSALFNRSSEKTDDLFESDMYIKVGAYPGFSKNQLISRDLLVSIMSDGLDLDEVPSEFQTLLHESIVRAWNASEDKSAEVKKGVYVARNLFE
tara:strand:- start:168029 stop:168463 length:435 start_codon:yes stop_codon:yes gene_type:complete